MKGRQIKSKRLVLAIAAALAAVSTVKADAVRGWCGTVAPDMEALKARFDKRISHSPKSRKLAYALSGETRLDVVDILIAFDISAVNWISSSGHGTPAEFATNCIARLNDCLQNSHITNFAYRLAGVVTIAEDASTYRDANNGYVDSLGILTGKLVAQDGSVVSRGEWKRITDMRETAGADIVSVLVSIGSEGYIGYGYALDNRYGTDLTQIRSFGDCAYNICSVETVSDGCTMAHEIGHNMGCGHPDATCMSAQSGALLGPQLYSYSSGYYLWIGGAGYHTIMGYNFGGLGEDGTFDAGYLFTELPMFSSPDVSYNGLAVGTSVNDNRRTLLATYQYVSQFRVSRSNDGDTDGGGDGEEEAGSTNRIFSTEYKPAKAISAKYPYVGAVYFGGDPVAIIQLKCGKPNKTGVSKVSATVIGVDGKKRAAKAVPVTCGYDAQAELSVKDLGVLSLTLGGDGFSGKLAKADGTELDVGTAPVGEGVGDGEHRLFIDGFELELEDARYADYKVINDTVPSNLAFRVSGKKWDFGKVASIKYKKTKDENGVVSYVEAWPLDPKKTNYPGMKVTYAPKTGLFKGSFKVSFSNVDSKTDTAKAPKAKSFTVKLSGFVVDGFGYGSAIYGKSPVMEWPVRIE